MKRQSVLSRRQFLYGASLGLAGAASCLPLPLWAASDQRRGISAANQSEFDLEIGNTPVTINTRRATATGINGTVPGPLLRFKEGRPVTLNVTNRLAEDSSLHWHGLILPANMDGVPNVSFPGIKPGQTFRYHFDAVQNGTYWYHSHSGLQEQTGIYGPIIIDPKGLDPVDYDIEFVVLLSDWTFEDPWRVMAKLKKMDDYYNYQRRTVSDLFDDPADRRMWGRMRMSSTDIADITGASYTFLMNGLDPTANWTGLFSPGQRIRLRFINGSAMTFFNVRIPGLDMTVVQADGQHIEPVTVHEFQIGVAETYDVIVQPPTDSAYTIFAESMDRSGFTSGTLAPRAGMTAPVPELRERPELTMRDMGMSHGDEHQSMSHSMKTVSHDHRLGPGVANTVDMPMNRLSEPGTGLSEVDHRVLTYSDLRSLERNTDPRRPERTLEIHLTGNMNRYMWSFDGIKFSEVKGPIPFKLNERLRLILVNDTMMAHPIHLHGVFMELVNGNGQNHPRKHTVVVKPAERLALDITADAPGNWAFHCHLLYHMKAGMMQVVAVQATSDEA